MVDRTTKWLLATIAVGLWINIGVSILRPISAKAQIDELSGIASSVSSIEGDLSSIMGGLCLNSKIC